MADDLNLQIEYHPLDHFIPYERNSRTHGDQQLAQIVGSIGEYGFLVPILIDAANQKVIDGHGRLEAAEAAGLDALPAIEVGHLTETQLVGLRLALNKIPQGAGTDPQMLRDELAILVAAPDFDPELSGFMDSEISRLLNAGTAAGEPLGRTIDSYTIQYNLVFDDEAQQEKWYAFMRWVRGNQTGDTFAACMAEYIDGLELGE